MELRCGYCLGQVDHTTDGLCGARCRQAWLVTRPGRAEDDDLPAPGTPFHSELMQEADHVS